MTMRKRAVTVSMAGVLLCAASAPDKGAAPAVLQPVGAWRVEYSQNMCVLSHEFGTGKDKITFGFRPLPLGELDDIVIISRKNLFSPDEGKGQVTLRPGGKAIDATYESVTVTKGPSRLTTMQVSHDELSDLASATQISISAGRDVEATIAPVNTKAALAALQTCQDDLLRSWGLDPAMQQKIAVRAKGNVGAQFSPDSYPPEAMAGGEQGNTIAVYQVGLDGKVTDCRIVISSHSASLDKETCLEISHTHFTPALGWDGKPMVSTETTTVRWRLAS
ncbi:TonB family protein [Hephaestia mangrovi]|uniref:TonB family protein n=1 Tax=Hephaestia mangrovi TaxID=2873268 RepID=UPI001CA7B322|nr:TonB family protein [Hephaestia mangrovi]MBY8827573.1 TonB family protein [Hephaestia mangrovi]